MFPNVLLEQQHVGRLVGIALAVVTAALRRQQQYCIACFVIPRRFFSECRQLMYGGTYPREQTQKLTQEAGGLSSTVTMPACQAKSRSRRQS